MEWEILESILTHLCCTKNNDVIMGHLDVQNRVLHAASHRRFLMDYRLCLEMVRNTFSIVFHDLILLYLMLMHFMMHIQFKNIIQRFSKVIEYFASN